MSLAQRRRILFTMLTALTFRYPPGCEHPLIAALRQWLGGWPGIGRITAGMARQQYGWRPAAPGRGVPGGRLS